MREHGDGDGRERDRPGVGRDHRELLAHLGVANDNESPRLPVHRRGGGHGSAQEALDLVLGDFNIREATNASAGVDRVDDVHVVPPVRL